MTKDERKDERYEAFAAAGQKSLTATDAANAINSKLAAAAIKQGKTTLVKVVAVQRGYDNVQLRYVGKAFQIRVAPNEPLPKWVVPEAEWTREFEARIPEDYEGDPWKDEILIEECAAALWRDIEETTVAAAIAEHEKKQAKLAAAVRA